MRYVGSKRKIAKPITEVILARSNNRDLYIEPFVGGGSMLERMAPHFNQTLAGDLHEDLILMWQAVRSGWEPPATTFERYQELRYASTPSAERGFAGFGGSFGGRWFEGFARGGFNGAVPRNHQAESARAVLRIRDAIAGCNIYFDCRDYAEWNHLDTRAVIYCDPPYAGSLHDYKPGAFNAPRFWETASAWSAAGHDVYVSEYQAPTGWVPIWSAPKRQSLIIGSATREIRMESLWTLET